MSKFIQIQASEKNGAEEIRKWERLHREKNNNGYSAHPEIFTIMQSLVDNGEPSIRVFHWLKNIIELRRQSDGAIILRCDKLTADYLPTMLGFALEKHFGTKKIACVYEKNGRDVVNYFHAPERKKGEISKKVKDAVRDFSYPR